MLGSYHTFKIKSAVFVSMQSSSNVLENTGNNVRSSYVQQHYLKTYKYKNNT